MRTPRPRVLLAISAGFALLLFAQGAVDVLVTRTMFPTVSMPSFDIAPQPDGHSVLTELSVYVHTADGETREVGPEDLMSPLMYSAVRATLQRFVRYGEGGPLSDETADWLFTNADALAGSQVNEIEFVWQRDDFDIVTLESTPLEAAEVVRISR